MQTPTPATEYMASSPTGTCAAPASSDQVLWHPHLPAWHCGPPTPVSQTRGAPHLPSDCGAEAIRRAVSPSDDRDSRSLSRCTKTDNVARMKRIIIISSPARASFNSQRQTMTHAQFATLSGQKYMEQIVSLTACLTKLKKECTSKNGNEHETKESVYQRLLAYHAQKNTR